MLDRLLFVLLYTFKNEPADCVRQHKPAVAAASE
jgi:hypothetical protein